jgi:hypothetical protein
MRYQAEAITEAARELGMSDVLVALPAAEAADLRRRADAHFLVPGDDWWWERVRNGYSYWSLSPGWNPMDVIAELCVDAPVWLMPLEDMDPGVFRAPMPHAVDILRFGIISEVAVVAENLDWMVMVNHHSGVFGAGDRVTARLRALKRKPGGHGGAIERH